MPSWIDLLVWGWGILVCTEYIKEQRPTREDQKKREKTNEERTKEERIPFFFKTLLFITNNLINDTRKIYNV